jgi:hypothetical protein
MLDRYRDYGKTQPTNASAGHLASCQEGMLQHFILGSIQLEREGNLYDCLTVTDQRPLKPGSQSIYIYIYYTIPTHGTVLADRRTALAQNQDRCTKNTSWGRPVAIAIAIAIAIAR